MPRALLHFLQREQSDRQVWASVALGEVIDLLDLEKLVKLIWPELKQKKEGA